MQAIADLHLLEIAQMRVKRAQRLVGRRIAPHIDVGVEPLRPCQRQDILGDDGCAAGDLDWRSKGVSHCAAEQTNREMIIRSVHVACYNPSDMKHSLAVLFTLANLAVPAAHGQKRSKTTFNVVEATIPQMQVALKKKKVTSRELVQQYLIRIGTYEDRLHAAIYVNPKALEEADQLDS